MFHQLPECRPDFAGLVFGIGQFAVCSQSVSKEAYDFASLPTSPRQRGVLPLGRYASHRHRFCRGLVDGGWVSVCTNKWTPHPTINSVQMNPNSVSLSEGFYKYWECGLNGGPDISGAAEPHCLRAV